MADITVVQRPEIKALVIKVPCNGHEVRRGWRELQTVLAGMDAAAAAGMGVNADEGFVFVPEWQWATGVQELWVGVEVRTLNDAHLPAGVELLVLPARTYAKVHVYGNRPDMDRTYEALRSWFAASGHVRDVREGSFSIEANRLRPVNPFDIPADVIDTFDFYIYAPIQAD